MPPSPEKSWLAAHIFFNGHIYTPECDRVVLEVAEPFLRRCQREGWIDQHFFIRYSELGTHVRFRVYGDTERNENVIWPALQEHVRALYPDVSFERPVMPPMPGAPQGDASTGDASTGDASTGDAPTGDASTGDASTGDASTGDAPGADASGEQAEPGKVTHVALIPYEPETERYGGPDGVLLAERYFEVSSEATYALLKTMGTERSSRLGKGLLSMVVLVHSFATGREHATDFAQQYGVNYLRGLVRDEEARNAWLGAFDSGYGQQAETLTMYVEEVWSRLDEGDSLSDALDAWHEGLKPIVAEFRGLFEGGRLLARGDRPFDNWEQAVMAIVSSYTHMHNNRLGISIQEEAYLAYLIMRAMGRPADAVEPAAS